MNLSFCIEMQLFKLMIWNFTYGSYIQAHENGLLKISGEEAEPDSGINLTILVQKELKLEKTI